MLHKHIRPEYEKIARKNNQTILYVVPWPNQYLHLKVKAETVDALKGIKIRIADKNAQEMWTAVGMAAVADPVGRDHRRRCRRARCRACRPRRCRASTASSGSS